jgi:hypothetical protein
VKDYTVSVYAPSAVTITDSNGKTSDPSKNAPVVTTPVVVPPVVVPPVVVPPVVVKNTTVPVVVPPVVVPPVVVKNTTVPVVVPPVVVPPTTTTLAALQSALTTAISQVASNTYPITYTTASYLY